MPTDGGRLHRESFVLDLHVHGPGFVPAPFGSLWRRVAGAPADVGFDTLQPAGVDAVVAKAVGDPTVTRWYAGRTPWAAVEAQLARIERQAADAGAVVVDSVAAMRAARAAGAPAVLLGVEGADALGRDIDRVDAWFERGVRVLGLVHLGDNPVGTTSLPWQRYLAPGPVRRRRGTGLSAFGRRVVARMNERGMLIDVAHGDPATVFGVVGSASGPVVSSHSGARALQDFPRYLDDEELTAIAATGGLVGLWPFRYRHSGVRDVGDLVAHARHIADTIGPEHLAIGTDLNGVPGTMAGYGGESDLCTVTSALLGAGFADDEVAGILGGNALRVLHQVERNARVRPGRPSGR